ncbi:MAG TPA: hypothetical protein VME20_08690 [Acidimicrobiales bacterium]|nr:hypothetical protein [Acidimicrobiales bacterium]
MAAAQRVGVVLRAPWQRSFWALWVPHPDRARGGGDEAHGCSGHSQPVLRPLLVQPYANEQLAVGQVSAEAGCQV